MFTYTFGAGVVTTVEGGGFIGNTGVIVIFGGVPPEQLTT